MQFHQYRPARTASVAFTRANPASTSQDRAFDAKLLRWAKECNTHEFAEKWADYAEQIVRSNLDNPAAPRSHVEHWWLIGEQARAECEWHLNQRPFYNVWPVMHDLIHDVRLDVRWQDVRFPYKTMVFSFPKGREPLGITSAMAWFGVDLLDPAALKFGCVAETTTGGNDALGAQGYIPDQTAKIADWIDHQHTHVADSIEVTPGFWKAEFSKGKANRGLFLLKLMVFVSHVAKDDRILNDVLLRSDREQAERVGDDIDDEWLKGRAAKARASGVVGVDVGRELQHKIDAARALNPSLVNPHVRLYHTGPGRTKPQYRVIGAHFRNKNIITRVPTGYWGFETEEEALAAIAPVDLRCDCVYFLRDGDEAIVKVGWTGRDVQDRIADLSTGNLKLRLLGIVRTGNGAEKEAEIHTQLANVRIDLNREWFRLTDAEVAEILELHGGEWLAK